MQIFVSYGLIHKPIVDLSQDVPFEANISQLMHANYSIIRNLDK